CKGAKPFPLTPQEVDKILNSMGLTRLELGNELKEDDMIKVIQGPFANMFGKIKSFDLQNQILEVKLDLFGQETVVEIPLVDVEKA
ncbi:MAG: transcription termination/antitermination protein NusG, partial [Bacilli bacterium]|nr:transcription termination/antitermination protein NusG [Bacilli bacterium]